MRTGHLALIAACAGCRFTPGVVIDGGADGIRVDIPAGTICLGEAAYEVCADSPTETVPLAGPIDTDASSLCDAKQLWAGGGQREACFIIGTDITIGSTETATFSGDRPLVLVASGSITIAGTLDVSSHRMPPSVGPGAPSSACKPFDQNPGDSSSGAAGGAGASFMSLGGDGGDGNATNVDGRAPAADSTPPTALRAGCNGQRGGTGDAAPEPGAAGGGAVYLVANAITIDGTINASGAGAAAGPQSATKSGGSGGGSGGMIKLYAATIVTAGGTVMANGGGGASGIDENGAASPGDDPATATTAASGGARVSNSGAGGNGFAGSLDATNGGVGTGNNTGGGGGGGGGGYIQSNHALSAATISAGLIEAP